MARDLTKLDGKLTELMGQMQKQRAMLGDTVLKTIISTAIKLSRQKCKRADRAEHDKTVREHPEFKAFCESIGLNLDKV